MLAESHFYFHKADDVLGLSDKVRTILRTAAFVLAIRRVGRAALSRVHVGMELPF
jgi:hypothetical protein